MQEEIECSGWPREKGRDAINRAHTATQDLIGDLTGSRVDSSGYLLRKLRANDGNFATLKRVVERGYPDYELRELLLPAIRERIDNCLAVLRRPALVSS